jgi:hypothetical protein
METIEKIRLCLDKVEEMKSKITQVEADRTLPVIVRETKLKDMRGCLRDLQVYTAVFMSEYLEMDENQVA